VCRVGPGSFPEPSQVGSRTGAPVRSKFVSLFSRLFVCEWSHYLDRATFQPPPRPNAACGFPHCLSCFAFSLIVKG